ncbi:MAG: fibronectin type III domain-containing protein [Bdellovibrionales bacterium]|nr:fibronectin type III domain-containing protein [Bdellovibrionales bacterium]
MKVNNIRKKIENNMRLKVNILTFFFLFSVAGCLPKEESVVEVPATGETYGNFKGLDSVTTIASSKVNLKWTPTENKNVVAYNVYDVTVATLPKLIKTVDATRDSATIAGLSEGFYYSFRVRAVDADGKEDVNTNDLVGIPYGGIKSVTVLSSSSAQVEFSSVTEGEALEINIHCKTSANGEYVLMANIRNMSLNKKVIEDLTPNLTYTCKASIVVEGYADNNEETISFQSLGKASQIVFETQPGNGAAGEALSQQPVIKLLDENDNLVTGGPDATALITLEVSVNTPTVGSVRGTVAINAVGGVATFTDIFFQESGAKILNAIKEDTSAQFFGTTQLNVESNQFMISPGNVDPTQSLIAIDPAVPPATALVANGSDTYTVTITLNDSFGNPVPGIKPKFASNIIGDFLIQPFLNTDNLGQTSGSISTTVADNVPPARILSVSSPAGLTDVQTLAPFVAGEANKLAFSVQPINSPAGDFGLNDVKVAIQDQQGNTVVSGASSSLAITMSIASNVGGAILSGQTTVSAVNGIATFTDLGIDITKTGYNLVASSGSLTPAYSNSFNITAGVPQAVSLTGPADVLSGSCSTAITVQLQDLGGNPAKAIQNATVLLSGMGSAVLYSSNSCGGSPLGTSVTFTPGTDTRTVYLKSDKVESLNISATDTSAVLSPGLLNVRVNPNKMRMLAQASGGGTLKVPSGQCSTAVTITPLAEDGSLGEFFLPTTSLITGIVGSQVEVYSNDTCTIGLDPNNLILAANPRPNSETTIYLKNPKGETLNINISDPGANIQTTSLPQEVIFTASDIELTGPSTVVAGQCSTVFTITLKDTLGNSVPTDSNLNLNINGINGVSATGKLYTSPTCGGTGSATSLTVPGGNSSIGVYYKGVAAEILNISITDPAGNLSASSVLQLTITPSAFEIVSPGGSSSNTSECVGPFDVNTLDGLGNPANAVNPITANLSGQGIAGKFYSDLNCSSIINSLNFAAGEGTKQFYFVGQYPDTLTLTVTDNAAILTQGTLAWTINADWGWIGTATKNGGVNDMLPVRMGIKPVAARYDGIFSAYDIEFSPDYRYMYIADYYKHKVTKFDYQNNQYIGWMGRIQHENGVGSTGSNLVTPSPALCINTLTNDELPGWCTGGISQAGGEYEVPEGAMSSPIDIAADENYIYVVQNGRDSINRYEAETGAFAGWIGRLYNVKPTGPGPGGPPNCTVAANDTPLPGWCIDGRLRNVGWTNGNYNLTGDGRMVNPRGVVVDDTYMYVASQSAINRFDKTTGAFAGWIGMVHTTPSSGAAGCSSAPADTLTPGWCFGGVSKRVHPYNHSGLAGGVYAPTRLMIIGTTLYVADNNYGSHINTYDKDTGAFIEALPNMNHNWKGLTGITTDGTKIYAADEERILKVDFTGLIESWMGKVANNSGMSGNVGCNTLNSNENTPGWCIGGTGKGGLDADSFIRTRAIAYDGNGNILVSGERYPGVKKFNASTGQLQGIIALEDNSPSEWTSNRITAAEDNGFDDKSYYSPRGVLVHGDYVFTTEYDGSRIKKINKYTGELVGWVGGMTSKPTGGSSPLCLLMGGMGASPSWCKGANFYPDWLWYDSGMIDYDVDGVMNRPYDLATDGTWLYVTDYDLNRVQRFRLDDGTYGGWIGRINNTPTGGDPGCAGAPVDSFTPGWCKGGAAKEGNGYGYMRDPAGIAYAAGSIYVVNRYYHNISKYNAVTGAFEGWIGRVNSNPSSGCTPASNGDFNVSNSGWCLDGNSQAGQNSTSRGGDFSFDVWSADVHSDGTYLYVSNGENRRIEKYNLNGQWLEAAFAEGDNYTKSWESDRAVVRTWGTWCSRVMSMWMDSTHIYTLNRQACARSGSNLPVYITKIDKATGTMIGWKGGIDPDFTPTGGDFGCSGATGSTPGWCQGGRVGVGSVLGTFMHDSPGAISGDANFLYVTDFQANRLIRVPK